MGFANVATAAQWELKGSLGQQVKYDDNIAFRPIKQAVVGYLLTPSLQASYKTGSLEMGFNGGGDIRRYDDPRWDCENFNLGLNNRYLTRRSVFGLSGGYSQGCSYAQQIVEDTGILAPNSQSENYNLAPSWTWQWTPRDQLTVGTSYSKQSFSNSRSGIGSSTGIGSIGFSGNDTYSANLGMNHVWSRRISLNGGLYFSNIQYTGTNASTQNIFGFQLGGSYSISQKWTANVGGGLRLADIQPNSNSVLFAQNASLVLGNTANISVSYKDRLSNFTTGYSNAVSPSAIGQTLQIHSIFASYSYQFTHQISLNLNSNLSRSEPIGGQSTGNPTTGFSRDYATATAALAWEFERDWQLRGSYVYRWQQYKQQETVSDSNAVMLSLNYTWDGIRDLSDPY